MINFRSPLNNILGHIRYGLAQFRRWFLKVCVLTPGHWKWAAGAIRSIGFIFDAEKKGTVLLDQIGFSR